MPFLHVQVFLLTVCDLRFAENDCQAISVNTKDLFDLSQYVAFDCPNKTNVMINYPREIGYQGDLKISQANVTEIKEN